ncbi:hypothetical protein Tco_1531090 [Tanacetum coccineum]
MTTQIRHFQQGDEKLSVPKLNNWYGNGGKCVGDKQVVWMTHGDEAVKVSNEFQAVVIVCIDQNNMFTSR